MGKFLKRAGSLLMVPLLPGRGWQEPAGCWTCWLPPGANRSLTGANVRALVAPALPQFEAQKVNGSFPKSWAACAVLSRRRSSTETLWSNKHLNPQAHPMSQGQERLAHTHFMCLHSPCQACAAMACEREELTQGKSTASYLCVCFLQPTNAKFDSLFQFPSNS